MLLDTRAEDPALVRKWAAFYRERGFNPLPMRSDAKRPVVPYAQWWDEPAPSNLFDLYRTTGLQVMTGRRWRLLVIDLDGPEAREWWSGLRRPCPPTWATHSGGNGVHLWFRLPEGFNHPMPKAFLWRGERDHSGVERLCDRSLIVAPPSIHPTTGARYRFRSKAESPARLPMPAVCPVWILRLPTLQPHRTAVLPQSSPVIRIPSSNIPTGRYRAADVVDSIHDKISLARSWGLRIASERPNHAGWCPCHAISREDRTPSAAFSPSSGRYWEAGERSIGLFELAARLGVYADWRDAVNDLGRRYGVREVA